MTRLVLALALMMVWGNVAGGPEDRAVVDSIMRDIGIKYLVSTDRKLPKSDREKWEASLADYVNFDSLNNGMRERIRRAVARTDGMEIDTETSAALQEKAVRFLVPRQLSDYLQAYLRITDASGPLVDCGDGAITTEEPFVLCLQSVSDTEIRVNLTSGHIEANASLVFQNDGAWRLANIDGPISDDTLLLVAIWK